MDNNNLSNPEKELTYNSYLKVDELLNLQHPESQPAEHDEMLFIIIHQTYELWFKQVLHELGKLRSDLAAGEVWYAVKTMRRILTIMKTLVSQVDILETMTPLDFNSFRSFLQNSSGFQSVQFRELELICGLRSERYFSPKLHRADYIKRLRERADETTIFEAFVECLQKNKIDIPSVERKNDEGLLYDANENRQQILIDVMHQRPKLALLCELMLDFDEGLQEWRYRHVKMVERTIGTKMGTGGSDGAKYLHATLHKQIFPDLWALRNRF